MGVDQAMEESTKQLETAARNLDELGQRLKKTVERYKV